MSRIQDFINSPRMQLTAFCLFTVILSLVHCKDPVEEKCQTACQFTIDCVETVQQRKFPDQEKNSGRIYCIQGCAMLQSDILQCYEETYPSCEGFQRCVIQSGTLE